jgi:hypothetical protein
MVVPVVGLGRLLRLFRATLTRLQRLLKPTHNLQDPARNLQSADDFADSDHVSPNGLVKVLGHSECMNEQFLH